MLFKLLQRFRRDRRGNVAAIFGLTAIPLTFMVGMGVDFANATRIKLALQDATDSAAISLARQSQSIADDAIVSTAKAYIQASYNDTATVTINTATIDRNTITATVDATVSSPTYFSALLGRSSMPVTAHAVAKGLLLEIAMVLDTSFSMTESAGSGGSKIAALKDASNAFLTKMFGTQTTSQRVAISVVPFAASVNVGSSNSSATWMDTTGISPLHKEDFVAGTTKTRWTLFSDLKSSPWGGCVISRTSTGDLDVNDTAPSSGTPSTLFVPWFAPDEPDDDNGNQNTGDFSNNYLDDEGGACTGSTDTNKNVSDATKQARVCKYKNATPSYGKGPNYFCDSDAITPLTSTKATLTSAITSLTAAGATNILEGVMWGWRTLSPGAPFTQGKSYTSPNNRKVILLMTDGTNNLMAASNFNHSAYSSYGFAIKGRVGSTSSDNDTLTDAMDVRTLKACKNAKDAGVLIYTIAFGAGAAGSQTLLQSCASNTKYAFAPQNSSDLTPTFKKIADSINSLRLAE